MQAGQLGGGGGTHPENVDYLDPTMVFNDNGDTGVFKVHKRRKPTLT